MNLQQRVEILEKLGNYILSDNTEWKLARERAALENTWFTPGFIELASQSIAHSFLSKPVLSAFASKYQLPHHNSSPKKVGIVMAGNIPLVGFHDFLCCFISGHIQYIKASSKDQVLIKHLSQKLMEWDASLSEEIFFADMLKGCDAYIATGSNNSSRYFEQYFGKYPHIIRKNRTSIAVLDGKETKDELEKLAADVYQYFGLGCRNVTKIYVPERYDFVPLLEAFKKFNYLADHHKYKNNYDYQLAVLIINKRYYMTNGSIILYEDKSFFSPISQLNYEFYNDESRLMDELRSNSDIQCIVGKKAIPFGQGQNPAITDFADGVDTMKFLLSL
jgi:hypothetical protein